MTTKSITSARDSQKKQVRHFAEHAVERALKKLGKDAVQALIGRGGEFQADIEASIARLSVSNRFANEEVSSTYGYPSGYRRNDLVPQSNRLRELLPGIGFVDEKAAAKPLPEGMEGCFAIPRWERIAPTYGQAVEKVLSLIGSRRPFYNYRQGALGPQHLRQHERSAMMWAKIGAAQKDYDILAVPAQFGLLHRGRSVRRSREVFAANEFGLGAFATACMLLTHPERLVKYEDLWIDCAGDEYAPEAGGDFASAPCWYFSGGGLKFRSSGVDRAYSSFGSASAALPE